MRARYPDEEGFVDSGGVQVFYERYGEGEPAIMFLPTWTIVHSRVWKAQIPYFARHMRVLTFDGRGNGKTDRPDDARAYSTASIAADALAVMDHTGTERAVLVGYSRGVQFALHLAANHPDRVLGVAGIGSLFPVSLVSQLRFRWGVRGFSGPAIPFSWGKFNARHWRRNWPDFVHWWMHRVMNDPHSTKQIEDSIGWALETDGETAIKTVVGPTAAGERDQVTKRSEQFELASQVRCPVLVIHGTRDKITAYSDGKALARATGGDLLTLEGRGHSPHARAPVEVNLAIRDFAGLGDGEPTDIPELPGAGADRSIRTRSRKDRRALFVSSPIGLGHALRDVAIARELRQLVPGLEIDWLAQHPVTKVLEAEGERIHPASSHLASESAHIESESAEHDLHCFQAYRRMDEILVANFMLFHDVAAEGRHDLWIADEGWEIDYFLHENPKLKSAGYAWLTDFVGWLPMPDGDDREAHLTADYNAEMVEHIADYPELRDRSIFVGNPEDIVPERLGPGLPMIRDWTEQHFDFAGYITGFDPAQFADRDALRDELGYRPDEKVCIVTVGGSGVGADLLRRVIGAFPAAKDRVSELRMVVVAGPRIDPGSLPSHEGLEVRAYVHNLYRHLAVCDLAIAQGGLTTSMELTANQRPFIYFPLKHHFEQNFHVRHRLERYGAGRCMDYDSTSIEDLARAIAEEVGREVSYRSVETDGARRAAEQLAEML